MAEVPTEGLRLRGFVATVARSTPSSSNAARLEIPPNAKILVATMPDGLPEPDGILLVIPLSLVDGDFIRQKGGVTSAWPSTVTARNHMRNVFAALHESVNVNPGKVSEETF